MPNFFSVTPDDSPQKRSTSRFAREGDGSHRSPVNNNDGRTPAIAKGPGGNNFAVEENQERVRNRAPVSARGPARSFEPIGEPEFVVLRHELAILRRRFPSASLQSCVSKGSSRAARRARIRRRGTWHLSEDPGWRVVPKGRLAEGGPIPERYSGLVETQSSDAAVRTSLNVRDSDATLIVSHDPLSGGSLVTVEEGRRWGKSPSDLGAKARHKYGTMATCERPLTFLTECIVN
jgi:hypothetical protein